MRRLECAVFLLVEAEDYGGSLDDNWPPDEIGVLHHQVDRLFLRSRQPLLFEDRAARADVLQEASRIDVLFEERARRRLVIFYVSDPDTPFLDPIQ